jgi:hypothetical protein
LKMVSTNNPKVIHSQATLPVFLKAKRSCDANGVCFGDVFDFNNVFKSVLGFVVVHESGHETFVDAGSSSVDVHLYVYDTTTKGYYDEVQDYSYFMDEVQSANPNKLKHQNCQWFSSLEKKTGFVKKVSPMCYLNYINYLPTLITNEYIFTFVTICCLNSATPTNFDLPEHLVEQQLKSSTSIRPRRKHSHKKLCCHHHALRQIWQQQQQKQQQQFQMWQQPKHEKRGAKARKTLTHQNPPHQALHQI